MPDISKVKLEALLKREEQLREGLPFLHKFKHYAWSREYYNSKKKMAILTAANQVGKSTVNIRTCLNWCTNKEVQKELWRPEYGTPNLFWYFYPDKETSTAEYMTKWKELMPQNEFIDHPVYGWTDKFEKNQIKSLTFNSGATVLFKTYGQSLTALQANTVFGVFCDEELPEEYLPELQARLTATDGYFRLVFTATLGQELWFRAMERRGEKNETFPSAFKRSVSLYDCTEFDDGTPARWTKERIKQVEENCVNEDERLRRVMGRFVKTEGLKYFGFSSNGSVTTQTDIPKSWNLYCGVDIGSGNMERSKSAIVFVYVSPDFKQGRVLKCWRGDGIETTAGDVVNKYKDMCRELGNQNELLGSCYDHACRDFKTIANREGLSFTPSDKKRDVGEHLVNTLFRSGMLKILEGDDECDKLIHELKSVPAGDKKSRLTDDLTDALRYACMGVPWDSESLVSNVSGEKAFLEEMRREGIVKPVEVLTPKEEADRVRNLNRKKLLQGVSKPTSMEDMDMNFWSGQYE